MGVDYLYRFDYLASQNIEEKESFPYLIGDKSTFRGMIFEHEMFSLKGFISRAMFSLCTLGRGRIIYVLDDDRIVHTSFLIPGCFKFPFMRKTDFEIGPCVTNAEYRGKGIYPFVLHYITNTFAAKNSNFYMIVNEDNCSSRKGCEKAGFSICDQVQRQGVLGIWKRMGEDNG